MLGDIEEGRGQTRGPRKVAGSRSRLSQAITPVSRTEIAALHKPV
jgi:hypothetical protein